MESEPLQSLPSPKVGEGALALMRTLRVGFACLGGLIVLLVVCYLFSGVFVVQQNEEAFILRFGKIVGKTKDEQIIRSGTWHWAWPRPIDEVVIRPVNEVRTITTTRFWYYEPELGPGGQRRPPEPSQPLVPGRDYYLLTSDENILHTKWSLTYVVTDLIDYYSNYAYSGRIEALPGLPAPSAQVTKQVQQLLSRQDVQAGVDEVIRKEFQNVILKAIASTPIDAALYNSDALRIRVEDETKRRIARLGAGVTVQTVRYDQKQPPPATKAAFVEVSEAENEKGTRIQQANAYANERRQQANGQRARLLADAHSYRQRVVADVKADAAYFQQVVGAYRRAPETMLMSLLAETLATVLKAVQSKWILHAPGDEGQQEIRLKLGPRPVDPNSPDRVFPRP